MRLQPTLPLILALALAACAPAPINAPPALGARVATVPALVGRARFPERTVPERTLLVKEPPKKEAFFARTTILLLDATTQATLASTVADAEGRFTLAFADGFTPVAGTAYVLEGVRGLGNDGSGQAAVRMRTLVAIAAEGWRSITNGTVGGPIEVTRETTALALGAALRGPSVVPPATLIGTYDLESTIFTGVDGLGQKDLSILTDLVGQALKSGEDPVASVLYTEAGGWRRRAALFEVMPFSKDERAFPGETMGLRLLNEPGVGLVEVAFDGLEPFVPVKFDPRGGFLATTVPEGARTLRVRALGGYSAEFEIPFAPVRTLAFRPDATLRDDALSEVGWEAGTGFQLRPRLAVDGGDGDDGTLSDEATTLDGPVHQFTSLTVATGQTLTLTGSHHIRVQGDVTIAGTLVVSDAEGESGDLDLDCGGNLTIAEGARVVSSGHGRGGAGRRVRLMAAGTLSVDGELAPFGGAKPPDADPGLVVDPGVDLGPLDAGPDGPGAPGGLLILAASRYRPSKDGVISPAAGGDPGSAGTVAIALQDGDALPDLGLADGTALERFVPFPVGVADVLVTTAVDFGTDARARVRYGRLVTPQVDGTVVIRYQDSPDGTEWGPDWVTADELPLLHGRYLRVRAELLSDDPRHGASLHGLMLRSSVLAEKM